MNNQTTTQESVKKAMAKQTLGLPLTPHEHSLIVLYGQSPISDREDKPAFVEKYLKPLLIALRLDITNAVYRKESEHNEIITVVYKNGNVVNIDVSRDSLITLTSEVIKKL